MKNNDDFFGTMFDFDGDGHTDITETYMAYRMMNDDDDSFTPRRAPSGSSSGSGLTAVVVIIVILLIIGWFFGGCSRQSNSKLSSSYSYSSSKKHSSSYDDVHTTNAWRYLKAVTGTPVEHNVVERIKYDKSLVDIKIAMGISKAYYKDSVTAFVLLSSDSDFWLFTPPLIQFLSRSMNDSKNTPHFHFKGCHFHFEVPHFHFRGCHFHFEVPHFHFRGCHFHFGVPRFHFLGCRFQFHTYNVLSDVRCVNISVNFNWKT